MTRILHDLIVGIHQSSSISCLMNSALPLQQHVESKYLHVDQNDDAPQSLTYVAIPTSSSISSIVMCHMCQHPTRLTIPQISTIRGVLTTSSQLFFLGCSFSSSSFYWDDVVIMFIIFLLGYFVHHHIFTPGLGRSMSRWKTPHLRALQQPAFVRPSTNSSDEPWGPGKAGEPW